MLNYHFSCVNDDSSHFLSDYNLHSLLSEKHESQKRAINLCLGSHISIMCDVSFPMMG